MSFKIVQRVSMVSMIIGLTTLQAQQPRWTRLFRKNISPVQAAYYAERRELIFSRYDVPFFSQLIFSWNAFRPSKGYFSFYVQVRNAKNKEWHEWHHMGDWGATVQRSYFNKNGVASAFHHVRLEVSSYAMADSFKIKVVPKEGASLRDFRGLAVNLAHLKDFTFIDQNYKELPAVHIDSVPRRSQMVVDHVRAEHMCSPTALSMLLGYIQVHPVDVLETALKVYDNGLEAFGSWPFNIAHAFDYCKGNFFFYVARLSSFRDLYAFLERKMPVIVSVRGPLAGGAGEYAHGHLILVVGWDPLKGEVLCHDSAFPQDNEVFVTYKIQDFCQAWGRSHNLVYITEAA